MRRKAKWNDELALYVGQEHTLAQIIHNARFRAMLGDEDYGIEAADALILWDDEEQQWLYELEREHHERNARFGPERSARRTVWYRVGTDGRLYGP